MLSLYSSDILSVEDKRGLAELPTKSTFGEKMRLLRYKPYTKSYLQLHRAAQSGHSEVITTILLPLPQSERLELLMEGDFTPLHSAVGRGNSECLTAILTALSPQQHARLRVKGTA